MSLWPNVTEKMLNEQHDVYEKAREEYRKKIAEQAAEIERLRAALRPFAGIKADDGDDFSKWPDEVTIKCYALVRQIKEARAALEGK